MQTTEAAELEARLHGIFAALARGDDVSPAQRYRTEGFAQALMAGNQLSAKALAEMMRQVYQHYFDGELPAGAGDNGHIPVVMKRAPVYPSTGQSTAGLD